MKIEWEYKVVKVDNIPKFTETKKLEDALNKYGKEGWELVEFAYPPQAGVGWMPKLDIDSVIFKRQVIKN
jgi:hypothetical protein